MAKQVFHIAVAIAALSIATPMAAPPGGQAAAQPAPAATTAGATPQDALATDEAIEAFLKDAKIVKTKDIGKGVTGSVRATLSDGVRTHDAQIQTIDEKKAQFDAPGATEFNFEDNWRFNIAAYRVDRLLGLHMIPVTIGRTWRSKTAAFTWWIDDVMMDEGARLKTNAQPPDSTRWNHQMQLVRLFDQLIYNVDRNAGNLLISRDWRVWMIDHTRAFRTFLHAQAGSQHHALRPPGPRPPQGARPRHAEARDRELRHRLRDFGTPRAPRQDRGHHRGTRAGRAVR